MCTLPWATALNDLDNFIWHRVWFDLEKDWDLPSFPGEDARAVSYLRWESRNGMA